MVILEDYDPIVRPIGTKVVEFMIELDGPKDITLADLATEITGSDGRLSFQETEYFTPSGVQKRKGEDNNWYAYINAYCI